MQFLLNVAINVLPLMFAQSTYKTGNVPKHLSFCNDKMGSIFNCNFVLSNWRLLLPSNFLPFIFLGSTCTHFWLRHLKLPSPLFWHNDRLAVSYLNFLVFKKVSPNHASFEKPQNILLLECVFLLIKTRPGLFKLIRVDFLSWMSTK